VPNFILKKIYSNLFLIILAVFFTLAGFFFIRSKQTAPKYPADIRKIIESKEFHQQKLLTYKVLEKYGPEKTQDMLKEAGLAPVLQSHFLFHLIGDYVFKKYGDSALSFCTDYYYSACSHDVILNQIAQKGMDGVKALIANCDPNDPNAHFQCGGLIGHAFMIEQNYDINSALSQCDKVKEFDPSVATPCYQGIFMEFVWGLHDNNERAKSNSDPYYPCSSVSEQYRKDCWTQQPTILYRIFDQDLKKVSGFCNELDTQQHKQACFYGLSRQINSLTNGSETEVIPMCKTLGTGWDDFCILINANAGFALGNHEPSLQLCLKISGTKEQERCWQGLITRISNLKIDQKSKLDLCLEIKEPEPQKDCRDKISNGN